MADDQFIFDFFHTILGKWIIVLFTLIIIYILVKWFGKSVIIIKNGRYKLGKEKLPFVKSVNRLAFWKDYLPEKFQHFLSKYDGTLPAAVYDQYEEENKKEMEVYPRQMLVIYTLIDFVIILVFLRIVFMVDHHMFGAQDHPAYIMIEHIDVAGLINGALATILAIIIARIVESENETKKEELDKNIRNIKEATNKIDQTNTTIHATTENLKDEVGKILSSYTALERKDSFEERLEAHKKILDIARDNSDNILYYMAFSADFGCLRSQNLRVLMEEATERSPHTENLYKAYNSFNTAIEELSIKLLSICRDRPESVFLAFLDTSTNNRKGLSQHQLYLERVLGKETAKVIPWQNPGEKDKDWEKKLADYVQEAQKDDMAFYVDFERDGSDVDLSIGLKEKFVRKNMERVNELKHTKAQVTLLDRMAFQFILTMPGKAGGVRNRTNQCCVITFSNIDAIGDNAGVYGFQSTDKDTIDNLKNIFETYRKQQRGRDANNKKAMADWKTFTELFNVGVERKSYSLVKFKNIKEDVKEFLNGVAMADIKAAVSIQRMFRKIDETIPEIIYPIQMNLTGEEKVNDYSDAFFNKTGTYFAIGLFGEGNAPETLAEFVGNHYSSSLKFIRRVTPKNLSKKSNRITSGDLQNILVVDGQEFKGVWDGDNKKDIGLIAKLKLLIRGNEVTVFIVGGINHFGTERMGDYLAEHWKEVYKQAGNRPFVAVYGIDAASDEPVKQNHFVLMANDDPHRTSERD